MKSKLKPCPCGKTPKELHMTEADTFKSRYIGGDCCGDWDIYAKVVYSRSEEDDKELIYERCVEEWNAAKRAFNFGNIFDLVKKLLGPICRRPY
jgi:hypothetical protein